MPSPSTVGRARSVTRKAAVDYFQKSGIDLRLGDSLGFYKNWPAPTCIVSDGAYGVLGFEGDTSDHLDIPAWYEPHIAAWSAAASPQTTLWFWNSEIGWAVTHPVLERFGWRYVHANVWNKGKGHIAGNVNTTKIRHFPVVTELCVQYVREPQVDGKLLKRWLLDEWKRTGLPLKRANEAARVKDAAVRKYLNQGHLWYFPPAETMEMLVSYANQHGLPKGRPYFALDGKRPLVAAEWTKMRSKFFCPHGVTNVWDRTAVRDGERVKNEGRAVHLNQKPLDLMERIILASTEPNDVVWEPFGGLFTASLAAYRLKRRAFGAEIQPTYFQYGIERFG